MDLCSRWLLGGLRTTCLATEEADRVGRPSSAADGLSAKTVHVLALIGVRLPALREAEQRGINCHVSVFVCLLGVGVGCSSFSISTT